jgi:CRP/FNR family transcriptional regulator, anaerobic regulatory protein
MSSSVVRERAQTFMFGCPKRRQPINPIRMKAWLAPPADGFISSTSLPGSYWARSNRRVTGWQYSIVRVSGTGHKRKRRTSWIPFAVGTAKVGVREAFPFRESASAPSDGGSPHVYTEDDEFGYSAGPISFPAHSMISIEGEPSTMVYMVAHGTACLYKMLTDGRRQVVGFALPGDFLGSPFSDRYLCSVDAINEVTVRQLLRVPFLTFLRSHPENLCLMLEAALQETNAAQDHMLLLGRGTAEEKFAEFIIRWRARAVQRGALANLVPLPMTRRDIADFLGLTIETVSRVITKLERENVVRVTREGLLLMGSTERPLLFERKL